MYNTKKLKQIFREFYQRKSTLFERIYMRKSDDPSYDGITPLILRNIFNYYLHVLVCKWNQTTNRGQHSYSLLTQMILQILDG